MGTTGHPVGYYEVDTTEKVREWLKRRYTWDAIEVLDIAQGTRLRSNWWMAVRIKETGKVRAMLSMTTNRAKSEGMFYTKEDDENAGPYATDIPKRLFQMLTPLDEDETYAREWREKVSSGKIRA
jgi:hypothetical protein